MAAGPHCGLCNGGEEPGAQRSVAQGALQRCHKWALPGRLLADVQHAQRYVQQLHAGHGRRAAVHRRLQARNACAQRTPSDRSWLKQCESNRPHACTGEGNAPPTELQIRKAGACTFSRMKSSTWAAQVSKQYSSLGGNCLPTQVPRDYTTLAEQVKSQAAVNQARTGGLACQSSRSPAGRLKTCDT